MNTVSNKVVALFGPTACGKTAMLEKLFLDSDRPFRRPVVVVSADSAQVYRGMDIGSAKPEAGLLARLPHELINLRSPDETFSVGDFVALADDACRKASAGGSLPVISGGTAYYIKAFVMGLFTAPKADPAIRAAVAEEMIAKGNAAMLAELAKVDPVSAARIAPADGYRIGRALEVYRCSGRPLSDFAVPDEPRAEWAVLALGLDRPRADLYERIRLRVDAMMAAGLPAEVASLVAAGYGQGDPGMKAIGYAEFLDAGIAEKGLAGLNLRAVAEDIALHTRHYAKRQLTFMRSLHKVAWFDADDVDGARTAIGDFLSV
ncbi:MAG: tRNA (adenosine(37)-N6)-dimethylallyltransferase MiaA [Clostridia bacterium]|nr:tRNA (adenosine(37)-N6)-dimethylallyltransferase MiaA [Spirochaetia bacterium]